MTERTLWDYVEEGASKQAYQEQADKATARRQTLRRVRAGGQWLTLLRVARTIPQPFTLNDISVALWRAYPEIFGMRGYPYPDNHKVHSILYGDRGLISRGLITRVRMGVFSVPDGLDLDALAPPAKQE
jgi:hypothetical protein